jgi:Dual specificity phosphatase, catalytic domain
MQGARLDSFQRMGQDMVLNIHGLQRISSQVFEHEGKLFEKAACNYIPLNLYFSKVTKLKRSSFFTELEKYSLDDPSRIIVGMYSWQQPAKQEIFYIIFLHGPVGADMKFFARNVNYEISNHKIPLTIERDWSPAPPMPERLVARPKHLHKRFGGDPITIHMDGKIRHLKLFIGGLDIQSKHRPQVDAVLNLGEGASRWVKGQTLHPNDRAINKGEGSNGMTVTEIYQEAEWVIERLKQNQHVLVHCVAGMNRSTTICCAVLILLEGLSAEAALERVREHHPWARPDSHHWLTLRWLEMSSKGKNNGS